MFWGSYYLFPDVLPRPFSSAVTKGQRSLSYTDRAVVCQLFLQTTSPLKPLVKLISNFVCGYFGWSSINPIHIMVILLDSVDHLRFSFKWHLSETTGKIELRFCM